MQQYFIDLKDYFLFSFVCVCFSWELLFFICGYFMKHFSSWCVFCDFVTLFVITNS